MSGIIELPSAITGMTAYAVIHDTLGRYWNGTAFEVFNGANWSNYVNALTEDRFSGSGTGYYKAVFPGTISAGLYNFTFYQQLSGSPTLGDTTIGSGNPFNWNGTIQEQNTSAAVLALLNATPIPELTGVPPATPTLWQAVELLYMSLRNSHLATSSLETISNDAGGAITTATLSDNGTTYTKGKFS